MNYIYSFIYKFIMINNNYSIDGRKSIGLFIASFRYFYFMTKM